MPDPRHYPEWNPLLSIGDATPVMCNIFVGRDGDQGPEEATSATDGFSATVRFKCKWDDRNNLRAALVGTVDYQDGAIVRTPPFAYPLADEDNGSINQGKIISHRSFCTAISRVQGVKWVSDPDGDFTGLAGWGAYYYAIVTAEFTTPPYLIQPLLDGGPGAPFNDLVDLPYCVTKLRVSGEVFSPPTGAFRWEEGGSLHKPLNDSNVGFTRPRYELSVTRKRMPIVPMEVLDSLIGTVNEGMLQIGDNQVGIGAALFMGYNPEPYCDPYNGGIVWDIELLWLINGQIQGADQPHHSEDGDWNWYLDPAGDWSLIGQNVDQTPGPPPFTYANHSQLFMDMIS